MHLLLKSLVAGGCALGLVACDASIELSPPPQSTDQRPEVLKLVRTALSETQALSIEENVEYCGYIVETPDGILKVVGPARGDRFRCRTPLVYKPDVIVVAFHTHGAIDRRARAEIPSSLDFDTVAQERVDAFIATPGGRFWHLDFETATARLLCGPENCLPHQKIVAKSKEKEYAIPETLTKAQVVEIERSGR